MAAVLAYGVASSLLVGIAAEGDLEQNLSADATRALTTHAPLLAFGVVAALVVALLTLVARTQHDDYGSASRDYAIQHPGPGNRDGCARSARQRAHAGVPGRLAELPGQPAVVEQRDDQHLYPSG